MTASSGNAGRRINGAQCGFTLLEALIAIAIAAMSLGALSRAVSQIAYVANILEQRQKAAMVARSVLSSAAFAEEFQKISEGQTLPWSWRVHVDLGSVQMQDVFAPQSHQMLPVGRVTIEIFQSDPQRPVYVLTAWKPWQKPL